MFYTIYKTTNSITGDFYVGQHVTDDLNDGYLGSGAGIVESIRLYGKNFFVKEILFVFDNEFDMNQKEIDIVNESFLSNPLVLNRQEGGSGGWFVRKSVVIFENGRWRRIRANLFNPLIHLTPTSGTVRVFDTLTSVWRRIPSSEYQSNKDRYHTASSNRVSVRNIHTNETSSITLSDFDPKIYKKVLGGIVANVNGKLEYVSKDDFDNDKLVGCHANKVTVLDKHDGERKHVTRTEFNLHRDRYEHNTEGRVTVFDTNTQKFCMIPVDEFRENSSRYKGTTSGQKTVWDIKLQMFRNIPKEDFDRRYHRLASDKRILCYNSNGELMIDFWGTKGDFVKSYGCELYNQALKETQNYQPKQRKKFAAYIGCTFKLIDWSNQK